MFVLRRILASTLTCLLLFGVVGQSAFALKEEQKGIIVLKNSNGLDRTIKIDIPKDANSTKEKVSFALHELLSGNYENNEAFSEIPKGTDINNLDFDGEKLTIDLHQEFQDNLTNNHNVGFILDSLLGTAYQFDDIKEVEFLIDGAPIGYLDMYDFSVPFERPNPEVKEKNKKQKVSPMRNEPDADPVIVIDPGHGGKDPGSIGSDGTEEADLNLEIAKKLRDYLEDRLNATVYMTRTTDKYIDLDKRYALANEKKADIFISVHINSSSNSSVKGTTVIYPNNHHIKLSREAADFVHNRVIDVLRDYKSPYEDNRNLAVLRGTKMPAILTETGFISNSSDLKYLKSNSGQDEIANKIYRGVKDWWFD
ncbi:hypothetical protein D8Z77_09375 [Brevibacillus laterosporus]|nr:hypothetical protein D8Z77_09375 [Brevibacillus laterosporus]